MRDCIEQVVNYCCKKELIAENQIPWLRYSIEKRIFTILVLIPFAILAVLLTDFWGTTWFICSFFALRSRTNGYHSNSLLGCFFVSLASEILFLKVVFPITTPTNAITINLICYLILLLLAPYNHPSMHYSTDEILALKNAIRYRVIVLSVLMLFLLTMHFYSSLRGLTTGTAMATYMLSLAYISEWRKYK